MEKIKVFEMFARYGGASFALTKANIPHEVVGYSEIDKDAIKCYDQNFPGIKNFGDCTKINPSELPDFDLLTGGFPCQSFSMAGKRKGFGDTRGTLFNDIVRIAKEKKPRYMVLENVKGLMTHDLGITLRVIVTSLQKIGYDVIYKLLNSRDYGTPQSRERVWLVCKYGTWDFMQSPFPLKEKMQKKWRDFVDEEKNFIKVKKTPSRDIMRKRCKNITHEPHCQTITLKQDRFPNAGIIDFEDYYRFLTPLECFRLMGFFNDEINIQGFTLAQKYKLAGNGWDINLASKIFKSLHQIKEGTNGESI